MSSLRLTLAAATALTAALTASAPRPLLAQGQAVNAESSEQVIQDTATPESIVTAAYEALARRPGDPFNWDRIRTLFLPEARLIPNTEQRSGSFSVLTPEEFIAWIDGGTQIGGPEDKGFTESAVHNLVEQYGDVAHVFSTYTKHFWGESEELGRGINSFQLVRKSDRWWIVGIVWDEDNAAGPIPERYRG